MGGGKALENSEPVYTPLGWKEISNLKTGDEVYTPSGKITTVDGVYPQGEVPLYHIYTEDGSYSVCCIEHIWECYIGDYRNKVLASLETLIDYVNEDTPVYLLKTDSNFSVPTQLAVTHIVEVDAGQATCITVADESHLFITRDFLITHNTYGAILDNLLYIDCPNYFSVFFRRSLTELETNLYPELKKISEPFLKYMSDGNGYKAGDFKGKAHISEQKYTVTWPNGGITKCSYLENDKDSNRWYGSELTRVYFDEFQFTSENNFNVLRSRTRSKSKYKSCIRCTLNPDEDHISYQYCKLFLDEEGFPIKSLSGRLAYFTYVNGILYTAWAEKELHEQLGRLTTKDELLESYELDYIDGKLQSAYGTTDLKEFMWVEGIKNYTYIPATLADNEILRKTEVEYASSLQALPEAKRKQLLLGCWHAKSTTGELWRQDWVSIVDGDAPNASRCRAWDIAGTEHDPNSTGYAKNPDWTAGVLMSKRTEGTFTKESKYRVEDVVRVRKTIGDVIELIYQTALQDIEQYGDNYIVFVPTDPNPMAQDNTKQIIAGLLEKGIKAVTDPARSAKVDRFQGFALASENGMMEITQADWNKPYFNELEAFSSDKALQKKRKDDQCDASADAFRILNSKRVITTPSLPSLPDIRTKMSSLRDEINS